MAAVVFHQQNAVPSSKDNIHNAGKSHTMNVPQSLDKAGEGLFLTVVFMTDDGTTLRFVEGESGVYPIRCY